MGRKVLFVGFGEKYSGPTLCARTGEVWTLNDWYSFHPDMQPVRIYNPHDWRTKPESGRAVGDWRSRYEESGAEIVSVFPLGLPRERRFDLLCGVRQFGKSFFRSTLAYMFAEAIWEGVEEVELYGIKLDTAGEYSYQVPSVLRNIEAARNAGIKVIAPYEFMWREIKRVDWAAIDDGPVYPPKAQMLLEELAATQGG